MSALHRVLAITEDETKKFISDHGGRPTQKDLDKYVQDKGMDKDEISEIMYDLVKNQIGGLEAPKPKPKSKLDTEAIKKLAKATGLEYETHNYEVRFFLESMIYVDATKMTEDEYDEMEKEIKSFSLKGEGYEIFAWNDVSGYDYWSQPDEETNYIQIEVKVDKDKIESIDPKQLKFDVEDAQNTFHQWDNGWLDL